MIRGIAKQSVRFLIDNFVTPYLDKSFADMCEVMQGADVAVISSLAVPARIAAAKLGVPVASVLLSPCLTSRRRSLGIFWKRRGCRASGACSGRAPPARL
jgi:hypothetical protein